MNLCEAAETNAVETIVALAGSTNATAVLKAVCPLAVALASASGFTLVPEEQGDRFPCGLLNEDTVCNPVQQELCAEIRVTSRRNRGLVS